MNGTASANHFNSSIHKNNYQNAAVASHKAISTIHASSSSTTDKRLKRLERNRESARLSRRRRKQYLEELEIKVTSLSEEMDRGRMNHASMAAKTLRSMRIAKLMEVERFMTGATGYGTSGVAGTAAGNNHKQRGIKVASTKAQRYACLEQRALPLETCLSRTNDELLIVGTFYKQQLMSLVQPTASKFVLWLTLQKDGFYRGGRAASERLSAARIGERVSFLGCFRA